LEGSSREIGDSDLRFGDIEQLLSPFFPSVRLRCFARQRISESGRRFFEGHTDNMNGAVCLECKESPINQPAAPHVCAV
jgi:hypothetical protein